MLHSKKALEKRLEESNGPEIVLNNADYLSDSVFLRIFSVLCAALALLFGSFLSGSLFCWGAVAMLGCPQKI